MPTQPETNDNRPVTDLNMEQNDSRNIVRAVLCSQAGATDVGRSAVIAPLVSYGGHDQATRDVPADRIPPHPTGVNETIVVKDGVNQEGPTLLSDCGRVRGVFDHRDGTREIHVSTRATLDEPSIASYEEFSSQYYKMTGGRGVASDEKLQSAFRTYVSSCASSVDQPRNTAPGVWLSAPGREMARWRREVKLEEPIERSVTFRDLLVYIAGFALSNQLVRLDHQFKGHLFEPGHPFYDFKRGQVKAINKLYKTVVKTAQGQILRIHLTTTYTDYGWSDRVPPQLGENQSVSTFAERFLSKPTVHLPPDAICLWQDVAAPTTTVTYLMRSQHGAYNRDRVERLPTEPGNGSVCDALHVGERLRPLRVADVPELHHAAPQSRVRPTSRCPPRGLRR